MADLFNTKTWVIGETIPASDLNRMEDGIAEANKTVVLEYGVDYDPEYIQSVLDSFENLNIVCKYIDSEGRALLSTRAKKTSDGFWFDVLDYAHRYFIRYHPSSSFDRWSVSDYRIYNPSYAIDLGYDGSKYYLNVPYTLIEDCLLHRSGVLFYVENDGSISLPNGLTGKVVYKLDFVGEDSVSNRKCIIISTNADGETKRIILVYDEEEEEAESIDITA